MNESVTIPLAVWQNAFMEDKRAEILSRRLCCPVIQEENPGNISHIKQLITVGRDGILRLIEAGKNKSGDVCVNFSSGQMNHRRLFGGGKGQAIAKATGIKDAKHPLTVLDATAGLGRDAFILASLGCHVTLLERSPVIAILLEDGLERAANDIHIVEIIARMSMRHLCAEQYMKNLPRDNPSFDIVYLDPMFPTRKKSAQVKKEMRYLRQLLSGDTDADNLLRPALESARYRVVVKRPRIAPDLDNRPPTYRLVGKANRFDIYVLKSLKQEK